MTEADQIVVIDESMLHYPLSAARVVVLPVAGESLVVGSIIITAVDVVGGAPFYVISAVLNEARKATEGDMRYGVAAPGASGSSPGCSNERTMEESSGCAFADDAVRHGQPAISR